ncbi:unnamed protein product [Candidula unifasciata]|uniref:Homeobox domain-containing protein n=1 Tax=Candidula unifasciata TaxID=100452 RepID=A0A8S3Z9Z1_9EUPU|nr:unnamed protein product [Candidula unifasciata]
MQVGHEVDGHGLDGSPSPNSSSPGEATTSTMGPNNQGAKSLRPPYEWMKPTAALPQAGKTRTKDKYRVVYSDHQRLELEKEFHFSKYITIRRKAEIASQLGLSERQVKIWFQNRRAKERKQNKKREEQVGIHQHGASGSNNSDLQQHLQHSSNHDPLPHPFIPKIELDEDKSSMHDLNSHTTHAQMAGLQSHSATPTSIVLHPSLHHSPNMVMSPIIMSRGHAHPAVGRYHDNVQTTTMSPGHDEIAYRMTANAESNGNNMNLSGSSDSGVMSTH